MQQPVQITQTYVPPKGNSAMPRAAKYIPEVFVTPPPTNNADNRLYTPQLPTQASSRRRDETDYWKERYYKLYDAFTQLQR